MKHFACLCGFRAEGDESNICIECSDAMYGYEPPIVAPNWRTIGQLTKPIVENAVAKSKGRRR
jgi:hypothetical protein